MIMNPHIYRLCQRHLLVAADKFTSEKDFKVDNIAMVTEQIISPWLQTCLDGVLTKGPPATCTSGSTVRGLRCGPVAMAAAGCLLTAPPW